MNDIELVEFLQWALPRLGLRWQGFRRVRRQVQRRIIKRMNDLGLSEAGEYREFLEQSATEWQLLDSLCQVTISRFYRDRSVFDHLRATALQELVEHLSGKGQKELVCWSLGCGSGEEPYTVAIVWEAEFQSQFPDLTLNLVGVDANPALLDRAHDCTYPSGCLRDLPDGWKETYFTSSHQGQWALSERIKQLVNFERRDIRETLPPGKCHVILCRNLAFTYFDTSTRQAVARNLVSRLHAGGLLVLGNHEKLNNLTELGLGRTDQTCVYALVDQFVVTKEMFEWKSIRGCPGRFIMASGPSAIPPDEQFTLPHRWLRDFSPCATDPVWVAGLDGGGIISFEKRDGTYIHTLNDSDGFERKLSQLKIQKSSIS